jgi:hypothetical protein
MQDKLQRSTDLDAIDDLETPLCVEFTDITRMKPALGIQSLGGVLGI